LYQLSGIQKGIQAQHAISRYGQTYGHSPEYQRWINEDETTIILTPGGGDQLTDVVLALVDNKINYRYFKEVDLYNQLTAVCFLVDERVWDKKKYPDPELSLTDMILNPLLKPNEPSELEKMMGTQQNVFLRSYLPQFKLA
jgi:hypothetical protein